MHIDFLFAAWKDHPDAEAIIWEGRGYSYRQLQDRIHYWQQRIVAEQITPGAVVVIEGDFSPDSVALFLALTSHSCILVPLTSSVHSTRSEYLSIAQPEACFTFDRDDEVTLTRLQTETTHELYKRLRQKEHPGLVLFSSGSTGTSKAAVHDLVPLLEKFKVPRHRYRTISFLLYDHIGGINTMLYTLSNAGCLVTVDERAPDPVLSLVEKHRVELLPTSPTFINLVLLSEAYRRHDLSSLKIITYGTEPMSETTLKRFHELFPKVLLQQTYGLSELGIMRSKSKSSESLWVKIGGEDYQTRVVDGVLHIKARSAMLGYLNAPDPHTADGWFNTNDAVEVDGDYFRILGRVSELINVGGEKAYPAEIESVILELPTVADATVYGETNPITGQIVCANVFPTTPLAAEQRREFIGEIKKHCRQRLQNFKVPVKINVVSEHNYSERFKKSRR